MGWWIFIPFAILVISFIPVAIIAIRKIPQLRILNIHDLPEEKTRQVKEAIIARRVERWLGGHSSGLVKWMRLIGKNVSRFGRRIVQRLYAMEQYYRRLQKGAAHAAHATDPETIRRLMNEAAAFIQQGESFEAEKRYIEIISHNPKYVKAYEELGNLYLQDRQYTQARETLMFASKIAPEDASVQVSLMELEIKEGNVTSAVPYIRRAVELRPHNPKYLDFFIETCLAARLPEEAARGLGLLHDVNPENKKLEEFGRRIQEMERTRSHEI